MRLFVLVLTLVSFSGLQPAEAEEPVASSSPGALELSIKAGGHFPQLTNSLGTSFDGILKVGYGVASDRRLQLFLELAYSQPSHTVSGTDPRLGSSGASYSSRITVRDSSNTLGAGYFIPFGQPWLLPYVGGGLQIHYIKSMVHGMTDAGVPFGDHNETATRLGGVAFGGAGLRLGPGLLLGELRFAYTTVSQRVTGTANIGALSALLGYGIML